MSLMWAVFFFFFLLTGVALVQCLTQNVGTLLPSPRLRLVLAVVAASVAAPKRHHSIIKRSITIIRDFFFFY